MNTEQTPPAEKGIMDFFQQIFSEVESITEPETDGTIEAVIPITGKLVDKIDSLLKSVRQEDNSLPF